ncbi:MAG: aminotransferase class IV [Candidatus Krumholzibacteriota bacterium]|nr:aminotransferase class IV [Candidatus Krumholzibacteriota bacterium]
MPDGESIVYLNGRYIPENQAAISIHDRGFLFADGVYEVIRCYQGRLFEEENHFLRLRRNLDQLRIEQQGTGRLAEACARLLQENDLSRAESTIYLQITRGAAPRTHFFPGNDIPPTIFARASRFEPPRREQKLGVGIVLVADNRWGRCDIKSIALLPNVLARETARERGAEEAVFVREGILTEGSCSNFCAVFTGGVVTHPENHRILPGITRRVVVNLCRQLKIPIQERGVSRNELPEAEELFLLSTTKEIMPVVRVDGETAGGGRPGPVTQALQRAFAEKTGK